MNAIYKRIARTRLLKIAIISIIIALAVVITSIVSVFAVTVPCMVVDGDDVYEFNLVSPNENDIVAEAVSLGMEELKEDDMIIVKDGAVTIQRSIYINIIVENEESNIIAYENECVGEILDNNEISYSETDLIEPSIETILTENTEIIIQTIKKVSVEDNQASYNLSVYEASVADVLTDLNIELFENDIVTPSLETEINEDTEIQIQRGHEVSFTVDGESSEVLTYAQNISDFLVEQEVELGEEGSINFETYTLMVDGMEIIAETVYYVEVAEVQEIQYTTTYIYDSSLANGESYVETSGVNGEKTLYYQEKYVGGVLVSSEYTGDSVTKEAVNEVVKKGSENTFVDSDGNLVAYTSVMVGECTAYSEPGGITSLGWDAQVGVVAVNPSVIPYGTKLYITSGDIVYGYAIAGDTGGAALSNKILVDLYYDTDSEAWSFGRRDMTVYILE